ncbi:hypothetical protein T06_15723 [Trichinella sp. T6]|nr:hypothetical protein T06_15723 [Trichinella sp. T6]
MNIETKIPPNSSTVCIILYCFFGVFLLGPTFLLLVFAHAILLDRQIFVVLVFILLGREVQQQQQQQQ